MGVGMGAGIEMGMKSERNSRSWKFLRCMVYERKSDEVSMREIGKYKV